jgi:hypothetical protein
MFSRLSPLLSATRDTRKRENEQRNVRVRLLWCSLTRSLSSLWLSAISEAGTEEEGGSHHHHHPPCLPCSAILTPAHPLLSSAGSATRPDLRMREKRGKERREQEKSVYFLCTCMRNTDAVCCEFERGSAPWSSALHRHSH